MDRAPTLSVGEPMQPPAEIDSHVDAMSGVPFPNDQQAMLFQPSEQLEAQVEGISDLH